MAGSRHAHDLPLTEWVSIDSNRNGGRTKMLCHFETVHFNKYKEHSSDLSSLHDSALQPADNKLCKAEEAC